jgi:hypothetical protein
MDSVARRSAPSPHPTNDETGEAEDRKSGPTPDLLRTDPVSRLNIIVLARGPFTIVRRVKLAQMHGRPRRENLNSKIAPAPLWLAQHGRRFRRRRPQNKIGSCRSGPLRQAKLILSGKLSCVIIFVSSSINDVQYLGIRQCNQERKHHDSFSPFGSRFSGC